jgi:hypothetical protein
LGINTTATVSVVSQDGTVIHREFIHPGRDIDRRDKRLKSVSICLYCLWKRLMHKWQLTTLNLPAIARPIFLYSK